MTPPSLTSTQIKSLKARAHHLSPVVMIGGAGLTDAVLNELSTALDAHELIKVRVAGDDRDARKAIAGQICEQLACAPVQSIGKQLVLFREKPAEQPGKNEPHLPKQLAGQGITSAKKKPTGKSSRGASKKKAGARTGPRTTTARKSGKAKAKPQRLSRNAKASPGKPGDNKRGRKTARGPR